MKSHWTSLPTPTVLIDLDLLKSNIERMQAQCTRHSVQLWPHIKTHKMIPVAKLQLEAGATGLTCAKIGEAEALLDSGVKRVFIAHSLVDPTAARRLKALAEQLDELVLAVTSIQHAPVLEKLLASVDLTVPVLMALDSGLHREGARGEDAAVELAEVIRNQPHMRLKGIYTHEGHFYGIPVEDQDRELDALHAMLVQVRDRIDPSLELWPGCSVTAYRMAAKPGIQGVRPGAYPFGDLSHVHTLPFLMDWDQSALSILATVVDLPEPGLALIDAGSKVFSSDKTRIGGFTALAKDGRDLTVTKCNEEHGYVTGSAVDQLTIGEKLRFIPAHVCTVINLTDTVTIISDDQVHAVWPVDARGKVQ